MSSRYEELLQALLNGETSDIVPRSRAEAALKNCIEGCGCDGLTEPKSRSEAYLQALAEKMRGGGAVPTQEKTVDITANGTIEVTPDEGHTMSKVTANVNVPKDGVDKIQRYIELNKGFAYNLFCGFQGSSIGDLLDGVDFSNVTNFYGMFNDCTYLTEVPLFDTSAATNMMYMFGYCKYLTEVPLFDTSNVGTFSNMFNYCERLTFVPLFDTSKATGFSKCFNRCKALTAIPLFDTRNVTDMSSMFNDCSTLTTVPQLDTRNVTNMSTMFGSCTALTECWICNIKTNLQVGSGTSYGHLLTLESLLSLCKECRNTVSLLKLTVGSANLEKLANVYVKLIDITDEMRTEDDLIDDKSPFVQCESTDEGAMLIEDYMATKNWQLA